METIRQQYEKNRERIFPGTDILPAFELKTLKAVQTIAGEKDARFATWFEALDYMYQEAMKFDFDIAIIPERLNEVCPPYIRFFDVCEPVFKGGRGGLCRFCDNL